jgi:hypothetical protein
MNDASFMHVLLWLLIIVSGSYHVYSCCFGWNTRLIHFGSTSMPRGTSRSFIGLGFVSLVRLRS